MPRMNPTPWIQRTETGMDGQWDGEEAWEHVRFGFVVQQILYLARVSSEDFLHRFSFRQLIYQLVKLPHFLLRRVCYCLHPNPAY